MFLSQVSFKDMVAQARAQGDVYSADKESDDNLVPYSYEYGEYKEQEEGWIAPLGAGSALGPAANVSAGGCSMRQACGVSWAGGDTRMDQPPQQALGSSDSGAGNSRAGKARDAGAAGLGDRYTTGRSQQHCSIGQKQHFNAFEQGQHCPISQKLISYTISR